VCQPGQEAQLPFLCFAATCLRVKWDDREGYRENPVSRVVERSLPSEMEKEVNGKFGKEVVKDEQSDEERG